MGLRTRIAQNVRIKNNESAKYVLRMGDDGKPVRMPVDEVPDTSMGDTAWNFKALNDDYFNAWETFEAAKAEAIAKAGLETIDIDAFGVGIVVDKDKTKFRREVSSEWCSPPCKEFREKGHCKHMDAMEAHNTALRALQGKVADAEDPAAAFNRYDENYANPDNIVLMVADEDALKDTLDHPEKYETIMLAKDADGHPAIWVRPANATVLEDGTSPDDDILTELDPVYAKKIEGIDLLGPEEGIAIQVQKITLDDGKEHVITYISDFDQHHKELDEIKDGIVQRIEAGGKTGPISPEEGINTDIDELARVAAHWPQLPQEYHEFVEKGRHEVSREEFDRMSPEDQTEYKHAREVAERVPHALDRTFMIKGWRESLEQFGAYNTERKTGEDILSVDLFGPYGSGKTYFAEVVAELTDQPFYKIEASRDLDMQSQLVVTTKKYNPDTGQSELVSQKAGLAQALEMVEGSVVLLDESVQMNTADQRLLNSIIQNAKYTATMSAEDGFTTHKVNRKTVLFTAHNTDMAGEGVAADNDPSLSSRQATAIYFPPSPKEVKAIQMVRYAANMTAEKPINPNKAMLMVEFLDALRPLYTGENSERLFRMPPNDPRDERRIGILLARLCHDSASPQDLRKAAEIICRTVVNKYTDKSDEDAIGKAREAVLDTFSSIMTNPSFPFKWQEMADAIEQGIKWSDAENTMLEDVTY